MVWIWLLAGAVFVCLALLAALLAFGTAEVGPPREGLGFNTGLENLNESELPAVRFCPARDGQHIP